MAGRCAWQGVCMAGGVHSRMSMHGRGHAWQGGVHGRGHAWHMVNEWAVQILLECILVVVYYHPQMKFGTR